MSDTAKGLLNVQTYQNRWSDKIGKRYNRIFDDRDQALADALRLAEQRSDDYYPAVVSYDDALTGLAISVLTGLVLTGTNFIGATEKATGISDEGSATKELTWTRVVPGDEDVTVTIASSGVANNTVSAAWNSTTKVLTVTCGTLATAGDVETAIPLDAAAKFITTVSATGDGSGVPTAGSTTLTGGEGALPVLQVGAIAIDGSSAGNGVTSWTDTDITFNVDASALSAGDTQMLRLWVDDVLVLNAPLVVAISEISSGEIADGAVISDKIGLLVRTEAGALAEGDVVYVSGWSEVHTRHLVSKADANVANKMALWILRANLGNNSNGTVYKTHRLTGCTLGAAIVGDPIFADKGTAGGWVTATPAAGDTRLQTIGRVAVVDSGAGDGEIEFDLVAENPFWLLGHEDLENDILSADAPGRALMAANFFDATAVAAKFAADSFTAAVLLQLIQNGAFAADTNTRALFGDGIWNAAKLAAAAVTPVKRDAATYFEVEEDFNLAAGGTLPAPLAKDMQTANITGDYITDEEGGLYRIASDATPEAQAGQLTWADHCPLNPAGGLIFEARVRINIPGAAMSADERWVVGLVDTHTNAEDGLDATTYNAWFRGEGAVLDLFIEGDDGATNTDDVDSGVNWADNVWTLFKIDFTNPAAVVFSVNGVAIGTTVDLTALDATKRLQPIFCYQRDGGDEVNLLDVDWYRVYHTRSA